MIGPPDTLALGVGVANDELKPIPIAGLLDREEREEEVVVVVEEIDEGTLLGR